MTNRSKPDPESEEWRGMTPQDRGLSAPMVDEVFELLADWRRRAVCRYFVTTGSSSAHVDTVARRIDGDDVEGAEIGAVRTELVEEHLPRLDEAGVVDFDPRTDFVKYWGHSTLEKWAEHADAVTDR